MKINQLQISRFIAAISIVIFHFGQNIFPFNISYVSFLFQHANLGVSYFFVLSGFVMIIAYGRDKNKLYFWDFMKNRLARILPLYLFALFITLVFNWNRFNNTNDIILNLLMIQSWFPSKATTINFPGWSLSVEIFFYLLFPLLLNRLYNKYPFRSIMKWGLLFWIFSQLLFFLLDKQFLIVPPYTSTDILYFPFLHLNEFVVGNIAGLYFISKINHETKHSNFWYIITVLVLILVLLKYQTAINMHNGLLAIIFAVLIILISNSDDRVSKLAAKKELVFLGEVSFAVYILQVPVWYFFSDYRIMKLLGVEVDNHYLFSSFRLIMLLLISCISYIYLEKPMRNYIRNKI